ncbi:MAG: BON domain-containing protein [Planctomycetota bacterium]|nr:BON domain-containing protein [Planctomycetota bacterium]
MNDSSSISPAESALEQEAARVLMRNPHFPATYRLDVREADGGIRLAGRVDSFFHKQIAQESLRDLPGVGKIENLLEVQNDGH